MITLDRRLLILSGKGGVGKTTVAVAIALRAAAAGKEVLICEMGENEKIAPLFGHSAVSYVETRLGVSGLSSVYIDPHESFNEFARRRLKLETLWKPVVDSTLISTFIKAAPGLKELMALGNLVELEAARQRNGQPKYDLIILDAPATGHGLSLFRSPVLAMRATRTGPIYHKAKAIAELLQDATRTRMHIVTLAEEMPVSETLEMIDAIRDDIRIPLGGILVNAVSPSMLDAEQAELLESLRRSPPAVRQHACWGGVGLNALLAATDQMQGRAALNAQHVERLTRDTDLPVWTAPFLFDVPWGLSSIRALADLIVEPVR